MEPYGRRSRNRRRCHSQAFIQQQPEERPRTFSILGSIQSIFIMASLLGLIYMMLEYHCQTCKEKCDLQKISKSIDEIAGNLITMQEKYQALESKVSTCSLELKKIEGHIKVLEALAKSVQTREFAWNNKPPLPRVEVYLSQPIHKYQMKNITKSVNGSKTARVQ